MIRLLLLGSAMIFSFTAFAASGASGDELPPLSLWSGEGYVLPVGTLLVNFTRLWAFSSSSFVSQLHACWRTGQMLPSAHRCSKDCRGEPERQAELESSRRDEGGCPGRSRSFCSSAQSSRCAASYSEKGNDSLRAPALRLTKRPPALQLNCGMKPQPSLCS